MKKTPLIVCLLLILPITISASRSIEGYITPSPAETGSDIIIYAVTLHFDPVIQNVRSDGFYHFDNLPARSVKLIVSSLSCDCAEKTEKLYIEKNQVIKKDLELECNLLDMESLNELFGTITDIDGNPIPGVYLRLHSKLGYKCTPSDRFGKFRFSNVPVDVYTLSAEVMGMVPVKVDNITMERSKSFKVDIIMEEQRIGHEGPYEGPWPSRTDSRLSSQKNT
jgi:carboxypeptidase family protein